jgi:protein transport protein SEC61 subunit gamma and related proteins
MGISKYVKPSAWKERISRWRRTLQVARKPDKDEFISSAKISGFGLVVIGAIGFVIYLFYQFISGFL